MVVLVDIKMRSEDYLDGQICVYFVDLSQCFRPVANLVRWDPTRVQCGRRLGKDVQQTGAILGLILQCEDNITESAV